MRGSLIGIADLDENSLAAWQDLADNAAEPNPLFEPAALLPAARHLPSGADIRLVVAEEDGVFHGCFPVLRTTPRDRPSTTWPGIRRPTYTTQVRRNRYDGTPLVRPEMGEQAFTTLLSTLASHSRRDGAGIVVFEAMSSDGATYAALSSAASHLDIPLHVAHSYERPIVRRGETPSYRDTHRQKARRDWARRERQLGEALGGLVELVDRSDDAEAVETLLRMEAAGYKGRTAGRRVDRLHVAAESRGGALMCWPGEPEWFREMCDNFRSGSRLVLYSLQVGSTVLAMNLMLRGGSGLFLLSTIFDDGYTRYAPGLLLHLKAIDHFHEKMEAEWIDTCTYEGNETLLRMYPHRHRVSTLLLAVGGNFDRLGLALDGPARTFARRLVGIGSRLQRSER